MRSLPVLIQRYIRAGSVGLPQSVRYWVVQLNQMALVTAATTLLYVVLFVVSNAWLYRHLIGIDLACVVFYLGLPRLNQAGRHATARGSLLSVVSAQILIGTYFLGADSGLPLFYLALASTLPIQYTSRWLVGVLTILYAVLFVGCEVAFTPGVLRAAIPDSMFRVLHGFTTLAAFATTTLTVYLFRSRVARIDRALRQSNRTLARLSTTDELTNLSNRRGMQNCLKRELARMRRDKKQLTLLMCDVDYFKSFNDHYGHPAGDAVLVRLAAVMSEAARRPSDIVTRYGGEEFVLILPDTGADEGRAVARRIADAIARQAIPHTGSGIASHVTVSQGLTTLTAHTGKAAERLLRAADRALYVAKRTGRNRVAYRAPEP